MTQKLNSFKWHILGHQCSILSIFGMVIYLYGAVLCPTEKTSTVLAHNALNSNCAVPQLILKQGLLISEQDLINVYDDAKISQENSFEVTRTSSKRFSPSLSYLTDISSRKETFVKNLLPAILVHNEQVLSDRKYLLELKRIKDSGKALSKEQNHWLKQLSLKYKFERVSCSELLKRVDIIPPSLALGQAVVETGHV